MVYTVTFIFRKQNNNNGLLDLRYRTQLKAKNHFSVLHLFLPHFKKQLFNNLVLHNHTKIMR